ncbi:MULTISPECIES: DNA-binding protein [Cupriavidus]|uniref:KfrA N-terminal DNA-binding domain-containing protein n=1 Tax=Cupriavidus pinatubonensis (strain JMP 134 / LMG 1197) TaxID=264198 RepID=Q471E1_CUPPJ|nr:MULTISPECIES: DNA-binding protein [Cupriavidus]QYY33170.1 DNA-binding protein [Cupriavidus pinatubonensis]
MPVADLDLTDSALQADLAELRGRFPETRALYREVCGLLFFRYGVTPTANKLYSLVRKGSMGTPAEVLQQFWQELRGRTRVTIDHPDLPDALKEVAADAIKTIWQAANEAASSELAALRAEARDAANAAEAGRDAARAETAAAREDALAISAQLGEARQAHEAVQVELAAERQAHAATRARWEAGRSELEAAGRQLADLRTQFSTELERAREQVVIAQERAEASERRALRELDQERTARQKSDRTAEELRGELAAARSEARDAAVSQAEVRARLEAQVVALTDRLSAAEQAQGRQALEQERMGTELAAAQRRAERAEAEAALVPQLLAELRGALHERDSSRRRGKGRGQAPAGNQAQHPQQPDPGVQAPSADGGDSIDSSSDDHEH